MMISREENNKSAKIENLIWEIAKIVFPNSYIEPQKIKHAKETLLNALNE